MQRRPLSRRIIRAGFQLLGGRKRHWDEGFPSLDLWQPSGETPGAVLWKGRAIAPLLPFRALSLPADELAIVGSGPSLRDQRPEALPAGALLLNGALSLSDRCPAPRALVVEDERFVYGHGALIAAHLKPQMQIFASAAALRALCERHLKLVENREVFLLQNLRKPWRARRRDLPQDLVQCGTEAALTRDPDAGLVPAGTVAVSALQIALAGPSRQIALAGIDLGNAASPRFYEEGQSAPSGIARAEGRILAHFALANEIAQQNGRRLVCLSPVSSLLKLGIPYDPRLAR